MVKEREYVYETFQNYNLITKIKMSFALFCVPADLQLKEETFSQNKH